MLDYLIEDNNLLTVFNEYGLDEQDITFVKEQVAGPNKEFSQHHTGDHDKVNILTGLQIRGGKGYFSINFLEISIEN